MEGKSSNTDEAVKLLNGNGEVLNGDQPKIMDKTEVVLQIPTENKESKSLTDLNVEFKSNGNGLTANSLPLLNGKSPKLDKKDTNGSAKIGASQTSLWEKKEGSVLSFHKIDYKVKVPGNNTRCGCQKVDKDILKNISGICKPGMNAILGPTGSGKTSLLDILAGRKDPQGLSGNVLVDGQRQPANFKCMAGYVIQDDIVVGMLTVKENIHFSAALRLPGSVTPAQRSQRVEEVIAELGLTRCADSRIGTPLKRGVSGGERKRTNIAMELVTAPRVLFLDEPTTGLDATTAYSVMCQLQRLSRRGTTIVFSIHQPRYTIYKLFDNMMLLSEGEMVYQGPTRQALDYFSGIGYTCEEHNNPSDFFLDVLNNMVAPSLDNELELKETPNDKTSEKDIMIAIEEGSSKEVSSRQSQLVESFQTSEWNKRLETELQPIEDAYVKGTETRMSRVSYNTNMCKQMQIVGQRTFFNMVRNFHTLTTQVFSAVILSLLVGSIYFQVDGTKSGLQNRVGAFFFITMNFVFSNMTAMDIFLKDRVVFIHENISGYYRVSVHFLSKMLCDVIPQRLLPAIVFASISYWMIGLSADGLQFLFFTFNIFLTSLAGTSVALIFSATVNNGSIGSLFTALVWVLMMVFSGLLVNIDTVPRWLRWMKWLSIFRYSMNAFAVNELKDMNFCDKPLSANTTESLCETGNDYMTRQGIPHSTNWDLWFNHVMLILIATTFLVITYVQLRRLKKLN